MRRSVLILAVAAAVICPAIPATAGLLEKSFEISAFGGVQSGNAVASDSSFGLRFAYALSPKIEIEAAYDHFDTTRSVTGFAGDPSSPTQQIEFSRENPTEFTYYTIGLTANFLTETDHRTLPFISVGLGSVVESRDGSEFCIDLITSLANSVTCDDIRPDGRPVDPNAGIMNPSQEVFWQRNLEREDTGTLLTFGAGAKSYFAERIAARYGVRYLHHDSFDSNQDVFEFSVGVSFIVGGRR
jgi:hypothetical protein